MKNFFQKNVYVRLFSIFKNEKFIRMGTEYGGWFIPTSLQLSQEDICYFVGSGEDISFDCAIAMKYPCEIHIFDPTPKAISHYNNFKEAAMSDKSFGINNTSNNYIITKEALGRISFHPWGVSGEDGEFKFYLPKNSDHVSCSLVNLQKTDEYFEAKCYRISTIMKKLGHEKIKFLKMDIEGAEYAVIGDLIQCGPIPNILAIEFDEIHSPLDDNAKERINEHINQLIGAKYKLVHIDGSNYLFINEFII